MSEKLDTIANTLDNLSIQQLDDLVPMLEEKWGVKANPWADFKYDLPPPPPVEEKTSFDIFLTSFGPKKIMVVKAVRELTSLPLKESKDLVEKAPVTLIEGLSENQAMEYKDKLEAQGAEIEIK